MNIKTVALTKKQYQAIIQTMKQGFTGCRPNERIATALTLEANLGLRISDIIHLRLADIVKDGDRYRLSIVEQKTKKARNFTVPLALYQYIRCYCLDHGIPSGAIIFPLSERAIQKQLKLVCEYLGYHRITVPTASGNFTLLRFTRTAVIISPLSSSFFNIPPLP